MQSWKRSFVALLLAGLVGGCSIVEGIWSQNPALPDRKKTSRASDSTAALGTGTAGVTNAGINAYLWRAALDTTSFMPLASADPFGGIIITDWYAPPESPGERFKLTVYILGRELRADGLRVAAFRQVRQADGVWADAEVEPKTVIELEDNILTRARQLRINQTAE
ncbi:MAG: DUF3576 domain-containing protein [Alphaproteobacteria bacterium]|nr:DUF3576 domain-containing protein [Alphaproteobacteria bacterium]